MKPTLQVHTTLAARLAGVVLAASLLSRPMAAQESPSSAEEIKALRERVEQLERQVQQLLNSQSPANVAGQPKDVRVEELDQKVKVLERNRELEVEAAEAKAKTAPKFSIGDKGLSISSADTNFSMQLKGLLQVDSRTFFNDDGNAINDGFLLRRARPILQGTVFRDFDYLFVPDFGGSGSPQIYDAYLNYRYNPALQLRAGKFKVPVGLEQLQADRDTLFSERALPTGLVPNRDVGFQLHGELYNGVLSYAAGIFNGVGDGRNSGNTDFEDNKSFAGRVFAQPWKSSSIAALQGLGVGVGGSYEDLQRPAVVGLPNNGGYSTPAQQQFFSYRADVAAAGNHWRISPQAYYFFGPFALLGEYVLSDQEVARPGFANAHLDNTGWQIAGGWVLTGEDAGFTGVTPRRPFNPREGGWGALQLVLRYSELNLDRDAFGTFADPAVSARTAQEYAIGFNWYLNRNIRFNTSFSHINFVGGGGAGISAPASVTRQDENVLFTRIQLAF
jgi:phosphate-selective porin OprO/OprP